MGKLSPQNGAIVAHAFGLLEHPTSTTWALTSKELNYLLDAARSEGPVIPFYPPLMVDPMQNREGADARLRQSYVVQQKFVPDQTALVFRADIGTWLHQLIRLRALVEIYRSEDRAASLSDAPIPSSNEQET